MEKEEPSTSSTNYSSNTSPGGNDSQPGMNVFECTICLESAKEPIVTKCGHIFCWPCIYSVIYFSYLKLPLIIIIVVRIKRIKCEVSKL